MTPRTKAQVKARQKRVDEGAAQRKRGWVELEVPEGLLADAQHLGARWDPGIKRWIAKKGVQETLESIAEVAPGGITHLTLVEDCPWCGREQCFRRLSFRTLGTAEWDVDYYRRCDFCFILTSHPLFDPPPKREPDTTQDEWERHAWTLIRHRQDGLALKGVKDAYRDIDSSMVWPTPGGRLLIADNEIQMAKLIEKLREVGHGNEA